MADTDQIFQTASSIRSPQDRSRYLDTVCGDDADLRARLDAQLREAEEAGSLPPPDGVTAGSFDQSVPDTEGPGTTIGPYTLLELIGEGGFGSVYVAEQREPIRRRVAIKMIKLGMDSQQVLARFDAEKQALALMEHEHIAQVLDAGTTPRGRAYFVMEYVPGVPITYHCDQHRLSIDERLHLFLQVCGAIEHAHQRGIIHRDIKPSNVLVTLRDDQASVKVIDFGVAKALNTRLTEQTLFTEQGQMIGTPAYMSPEQAQVAAQEIDTRADVYALGILLYELLTGTVPFDPRMLRQAALVEVQRIIRELAPPRPSTRLSAENAEAITRAHQRRTEVKDLARRLHHELEWIPLKAIRKERRDRYRSASELADDIHNYISGNPLIAGPESAVYRIRKFTRRHRGPIAAAVFVLVALIAGVIGTSLGLVRAVRAEQLATTRLEEAQRAQQEVASTMSTLANALEAQDKWAEAESLLWEALKIQRELLGDEHDDTLSTIQRLTIVLAKLGKLDKAEPLGRDLVNALRSKHGPSDSQTTDAMGNWAIFLRALGRLDEAAQIAEDILEIASTLPGDVGARTATATSILSEIYRDKEDLEKAEQYGREALELRRTQLGPKHEDTIHSLTSLAITLTNRGELAEADQLAREALEICREVLAYDDPRALSLMSNLAENVAKQGRRKEGEGLLREVLMIRRRRLGEGNEKTALTMAKLAKLLIIQEDPALHPEAEELLLKAIGVFKVSLPPRFDREFVRTWLRNLYGPRGMNDPAKLRQYQ